MSKNQNTSDRLSRRQSALERRTANLHKYEKELAAAQGDREEELRKKIEITKRDLENTQAHIDGKNLKKKNTHAPVAPLPEQAEKSKGKSK